MKGSLHTDELMGAVVCRIVKKAGEVRMAASNICNLGIKKLQTLKRDPVMLFLIVFAFTVTVYSKATTIPEALHKAPIGIVDEDGSQLSDRIVHAFYPAVLYATGFASIVFSSLRLPFWV